MTSTEWTYYASKCTYVSHQNIPYITTPPSRQRLNTYLTTYAANYPSLP